LKKILDLLALDEAIDGLLIFWIGFWIGRIRLVRTHSHLIANIVGEFGR
jgi:hypothetical protein